MSDKQVLSFDEWQKLFFEWFERINNEINDQGIDWFPYGGTLLGFIRDGKMIPWDDDIDVLMSQSMYFDNIDKLNKISANNNSKFYNSNKNECQKISMIVDNDYNLVLWKGKIVKMIFFIDIFVAINPFDNTFTSKAILSLKEKRLSTTSKTIYSHTNKTWETKQIWFWEKFSSHIVNVLMLSNLATRSANKRWYSGDKNLKFSTHLSFRNSMNEATIDITNWEERRILNTVVKIPTNSVSFLEKKYKNWKVQPMVNVDDIPRPHIEQYNLYDKGFNKT